MNRDELLSTIDNIKCDSAESDDNIDPNGDAHIQIALYSSCSYGLYISLLKSLKVYYIFVVELMVLFFAMCVIIVCNAFSLVSSNIIIERLDLIISVSVVLLFNDKLFQLILSRKKSIHNESRDNNTKNKQKSKNNKKGTPSMDETLHLNDTNATDSDVNYQSDTNNNLGDTRSKAVTIDGKQAKTEQILTDGSISDFGHSSWTHKEKSFSSNSIIKFTRSKADTRSEISVSSFMTPSGTCAFNSSNFSSKMMSYTENDGEKESEREIQKNKNKTERKKNKKYYKMGMIVSVAYFTSLLTLQLLWTLAEIVCNCIFPFWLLLLLLC